MKIEQLNNMKIEQLNNNFIKYQNQQNNNEINLININNDTNELSKKLFNLNQKKSVTEIQVIKNQTLKGLNLFLKKSLS